MSANRRLLTQHHRCDRTQDFEARLREAWEARQARLAEAGGAPDAALSLDPVQSLADRLREAAASMSPVAFLRQGAQLKGAIEEQRDQRDAEVLKAEIAAETKAFEERLRDKPQSNHPA
ncbi:MAG: hypothetical protein ACKO1H_10640 [Tabrizicola sp.]